MAVSTYKNGWVKNMLEEVKEFLIYLKKTKNITSNTEVSYERDLRYLIIFLNENGILEWNKVTMSMLQSYLLFLEKEGKSAATIARICASIRTFFHYALRKKRIEEDPTQFLYSPKVEKKFPEVLTMEEVEKLLRQPNKRTPKQLRDRAMLELLYGTGIQVTEMLSLQLTDLNMTMGYISYKENDQLRSISLNDRVKNALKCYLEDARPQMLPKETEKSLFLNCAGKPMSRQGLWKLLKYYTNKAGIQKEITVHTLRHTSSLYSENIKNDVLKKFNSKI